MLSKVNSSPKHSLEAAEARVETEPANARNEILVEAMEQEVLVYTGVGGGARENLEYWRDGTLGSVENRFFPVLVPQP